ncbi:hypothetical protein BD413DRAFT_98252 [Trametes elegans]|nr:hypothetical protein BD413DRAFT_98252 [Trametes elegans]
MSGSDANISLHSAPAAHPVAPLDYKDLPLRFPVPTCPALVIHPARSWPPGLNGAVYLCHAINSMGTGNSRSRSPRSPLLLGPLVIQASKDDTKFGNEVRRTLPYAALRLRIAGHGSIPCPPHSLTVARACRGRPAQGYHPSHGNLVRRGSACSVCDRARTRRLLFSKGCPFRNPASARVPVFPAGASASTRSVSSPIHSSYLLKYTLRAEKP